MQARLDTLLAGLAAPLPGGDIVITALTADSREAKPGALFFALPGATLARSVSSTQKSTCGSSRLARATMALLDETESPAAASTEMTVPVNGAASVAASRAAWASSKFASALTRSA